ncbi:MAG: hypothetical protein ABI823_07540 [Bryobacteraceae bacterium]
MPPVENGSQRPALVTAACLGAAVLALFGALSSYQTSRTYAEQYPDAYGAARGEVRFAPVAAQIPANGVLGYITDLEGSQSAFAPAFLAAQYVLAPRQLLVVNAENKPEWALGNFSKPMDFAAAGAALGYEVARDAGNGVILFHRKVS